MGARANGPKPWAKDTAVDKDIAEAFQKGVQFCNGKRLWELKVVPDLPTGREDHLMAEVPGHYPTLRLL